MEGQGMAANGISIYSQNIYFEVLTANIGMCDW